MNILDLAIKDIPCICLVAVIDDVQKIIEVSYSRNTASYVCKLLNELDNNKYKNRAMNSTYLNNNSNIKVIALEVITERITEPWKLELLLRYKLQRHIKRIRAEGLFSVSSQVKPVELMVDYKYDTSTGFIFVVFNTGRYKRYWLNTRFSKMSDAQNYVDITDMCEVILKLQKECPY